MKNETPSNNELTSDTKDWISMLVSMGEPYFSVKEQQKWLAWQGVSAAEKKHF